MCRCIVTYPRIQQVPKKRFNPTFWLNAATQLDQIQTPVIPNRLNDG
jgi:hypothetical protein